jgi:hypothetical protein
LNARDGSDGKVSTLLNPKTTSPPHSLILVLTPTPALPQGSVRLLLRLEQGRQVVQILGLQDRLPPSSGTLHRQLQGRQEQVVRCDRQDRRCLRLHPRSSGPGYP